MSSCNAKEDLYNKIATMKRDLGIDKSLHPVNIIDVCMSVPNISLGFYPFVTPGLRGIAALSETEHQNDVIILNKSHGIHEQSFSCSHEMVHISEHKNAQIKTFNCFDHIRKKQNRFLEWQANEGAAELLVPFSLLLPMIYEYRSGLDDSVVVSQMKKDLSAEFAVSNSVIQYRLESLKYEIDQYMHETPLEDIRIMSRRQQEADHIYIKSLNSVENNQYFYFDVPIPEPPPTQKVKSRPLYKSNPQDDPAFLRAEEHWLYDIK